MNMRNRLLEIAGSFQRTRGPTLSWTAGDLDDLADSFLDSIEDEASVCRHVEYLDNIFTDPQFHEALRAQAHAGGAAPAVSGEPD